MRDLQKLLYVAERDIDLLLLEELNTNPDFPRWIATQAAPESRFSPCIGAWHSVVHGQLGESDIVTLFDDGLAILIENKIDAPAQPDQALRYSKRGEAGCQEGHWSAYLSCIVAPQRYLDANSEAQAYDFQLPYEAIRDWFGQQEGLRVNYRAAVIQEAIEQNRRGYSPIADEDVTRFWLAYWEVANSLFPGLEMPRPGIKPSNAHWPDFRPKSLGKNMSIVHKMGHGFVDL